MNTAEHLYLAVCERAARGGATRQFLPWGSLRAQLQEAYQRLYDESKAIAELWREVPQDRKELLANIQSGHTPMGMHKVDPHARILNEDRILASERALYDRMLRNAERLERMAQAPDTGGGRLSINDE